MHVRCRQSTQAVEAAVQWNIALCFQVLVAEVLSALEICNPAEAAEHAVCYNAKEVAG